jgi:hypothetical protein
MTRDPIMKDAVEKHQSMPPGPKKDDVRDDETLLDHLVKLTNGMCRPIEVFKSQQPGWFHTDRTVLKDEILNILIAGRDTAS